jgi:hypothetical protein
LVVEPFRKTFAAELLRIGKHFGFVLVSPEHSQNSGLAPRLPEQLTSATGSEWEDFYKQQLFMEGGVVDLQEK